MYLCTIKTTLIIMKYDGTGNNRQEGGNNTLS